MRSSHETLVVELDAPDDFAGFRQAARVLLLLGVEPECVQWRSVDALDIRANMQANAQTDSDDLFTSLAAKIVTPADLDRVPAAGSSPVHIRKSQLAVLRNACCHSHVGRYALCYRWLWRVQQFPALVGDVLDSDWRHIEQMAQAVSREIHKMHAFIRFRPTVNEEGETVHIAWFEPDNHILRAACDFFVRRFANMRWAILTPKGCVSWDLHRLQWAPGTTAAQAPKPDEGEALWLAYYQSTFNPARLKEQAMLREMPRRYWRNLPETRLIRPMVSAARSRTYEMLEQVQPSDPHLDVVVNECVPMAAKGYRER